MILTSVALAFVISSCQSVVTEKTVSTSSTQATQITSLTTDSNLTVNTINPSTDPDEKAIQEAINKNVDFFPLDVSENGIASYATIPNNGGVIYATVPNNGGVIYLLGKQSLELTTSTFSTKSFKLEGEDTEEILSKLNALPPFEPPQDSKFEPPPEYGDGHNKLDIKAPMSGLQPPPPRKEMRGKQLEMMGKNWENKRLEPPKREFEIKFNEDRTFAEVLVKTDFKKELFLNKNGMVLGNKNFEEEMNVNAVFVKQNGMWELNKIAPMNGFVPNKPPKFQIESVTLLYTSTSDNKTKTIDIKLNEPRPKDELLTVSESDVLTLQVKIKNEDETSLPHVFAKITASNYRVPLFDDGSLDDISSDIQGEQKSGDLVENDSIYTANVVVGKQDKIEYLTIYCTSDGGFDTVEDLEGYYHINYSIPIKVL